MGLFNFMTKKNNSSKTTTQNNVNAAAAQKAYWQVKSEFGRAPQARTANFLKTPGEFKKTNAAAVRMQELTDKFATDMGKELKQFGTKDQVKSAIQSVISQLETGIAAPAAGGGRGGADGVTIKIPKMVAKLLLGILKVILYSIGILFTIALALAGANGNLGPTEAVGAFAMADALTSSSSNNNNRGKVREWGQGGYNKTRRNRRN